MYLEISYSFIWNVATIKLPRLKFLAFFGHSKFSFLSLFVPNHQHIQTYKLERHHHVDDVMSTNIKPRHLILLNVDYKHIEKYYYHVNTFELCSDE